MVNIDLGIKEIVTLFENEAIDEKKFRDHLDQFKKQDFVEHLCDNASEQEEEQVKDEEYLDV